MTTSVCQMLIRGEDRIQKLRAAKIGPCSALL